MAWWKSRVRVASAPPSFFQHSLRLGMRSASLSAASSRPRAASTQQRSCRLARFLALAQFILDRPSSPTGNQQACSQSPPERRITRRRSRSVSATYFRVRSANSSEPGVTRSSNMNRNDPPDTGRVHHPVRCRVARCRYGVGASVVATTTVQPATNGFAQFLAGFVAGEGSFSGPSDGTRFCLEIGLGALDREMRELLHSALGVGHVYDSPRRREHYDDESTFRVQALRELPEIVVPFMDAHLPPSYKREQYFAWRERLLDYWEHRAKRVRPCTVEGCARPRRAHGLCRRHLYVQFGV